MQRSKIIFRADGNSQIGLGHVVRSLALAEMLRHDFECIFAIQNPTEALIKQIKQSCESIISLPETSNYLQEAELLVKEFLCSNDIIVIDGYNFNTDYQRKLKLKGNKLVCIDDLHASHFVADLIINHAPGTKPEFYDAEPYTKFCLGPEFALLRKPFLNANPKVENPALNAAFICFGGADPHNLTLVCLEAISQIPEFRRIHIVIGSSYPFKELLEQAKIKAAHFEIVIHQNLNAEEMKELMTACQIAVCPASSVLMEALSCKLKAITGYYVENQREFATYCHENGYSLSIGNFLTKNADELQLLLKESLHELTSFEPKEYIAGNPAENLRQQFLTLSTPF